MRDNIMVEIFEAVMIAATGCEFVDVTPNDNTPRTPPASDAIARADRLGARDHAQPVRTEGK